VTGTGRDGVREWEQLQLRAQRAVFRETRFAVAANVLILAGLVVAAFTGRGWLFFAGLAVAAVVVTGGWLVARNRRLALYRTAPAIDPVHYQKARDTVAGRVTVTAALDKIAPWIDQTRGWLERAPLVELTVLPDRSKTPSVTEPLTAEADGVTYEISEPDAVAFHLADAVAYPDIASLYSFAWTPFPDDHARSIVRKQPPRAVGSVHRTTDGRTAISWDPATG
jgi:hypothetical protein